MTPDSDPSEDVSDGDRRVFASAAARRSAAVRTTGLVVILAVGTLGLRLAVPQFTDPTWIQHQLATLGPFAPLAFIILQTIQVIVAPIPGQTLAGVGGYLFGTLGGTASSMLGVALGSTVVFMLTRWFGRPYVERVVDADALARWDDRLATLLDIHGAGDPADLAGEQVLVDIESGHPVPVSREGTRRGDRRAFYGVLAGIAPSFVFTLLSFFGLAGAVLSTIPFALYLLCTFVLLPPSLYVDAWHLRTTTDWEGRPLRWGVLAVVPVVNIAVVPYYLITRENARPLALDTANVP